MRLRMPAASTVRGRRIETLVLINDLNGISMSTFNRQMIELIRGASKIGSDYFPETLKVSFVINTPMAFSAIWAVIKHFFEEETRRKV